MTSMSPVAFLLIDAAILIICMVLLVVFSRRMRRTENWVRWQAGFAAAVRQLAASDILRSIFKRLSQIPWRNLIELSLIAAWAIWVGRAFLDPDPNLWPHGAEFGMVMQSHYPWTWFPACGLCALWNGWVNGGAPTLADVYGAVAHPLAIGSVIAFGLVNGAKFILIISLTLAGFAQWWLAKVMRLSWLPRLWVAGLAVVGGHLAGRMHAGLVIFILSVASISVLLAPAIKLIQTGSRRTAVVLGVLAGLALLAGQGYMQVAVMFAWLPALLVFVIGKSAPRFPWKEFALAGLIAILVAAILWVPMTHFWPNVAKDVDLGLGSVQPIQYLPLNLVIDDHAFYDTVALGKTPLTFLYVNYIGWIPVLLALVAIRLVPHAQRRLLLFFLIATGLVFLLASGLPIIVLRDALDSSLTGIRFPSLIASAAVPLVLGLAAWGFDLLLKSDRPLAWLKLHSDRWPDINVKPLWFIMPVFAFIALQSVYEFSKTWLITVPASPPNELLETWHTPTTEWVYPPFGQAFWLPFGLNANLKMVTISRPWQWKDRQPPDYAVEAIWNLKEAADSPVLGRFDNLTVVAHPGVEYAYVDTGDDSIPCRATALGGNIDVDCQNDQTGTLVVQENNWSGWYASRDGGAVELTDSQWLTVPAPAGQHHYEFRYCPWDVWVGAALSFAGFGLAAVLWIRAARRKTPRLTSAAESSAQI
jgi:hypothetical protein